MNITEITRNAVAALAAKTNLSCNEETRLCLIQAIIMQELGLNRETYNAYMDRIKDDWPRPLSEEEKRFYVKFANNRLHQQRSLTTALCRLNEMASDEDKLCAIFVDQRQPCDFNFGIIAKDDGAIVGMNGAIVLHKHTDNGHNIGQWITHT